MVSHDPALFMLPQSVPNVGFAMTQSACDSMVATWHMREGLDGRLDGEL